MESLVQKGTERKQRFLKIFVAKNIRFFRHVSIENTLSSSLFQAPLQRPDYSSGGIVERVIRADSGSVELLRGRDHIGTGRPAAGATGDSRRQSEKTEGTLGEVRHSQGRSFRVRVLESHSSLQGG